MYKKLYYTIQYSVSRMESQDQTLYYKKKRLTECLVLAKDGFFW